MSCIFFKFTDSTTMCAQTIFTCLDHLTAWANGKRKAAVVRKARGQRQMGEMWFHSVMEVSNWHLLTNVYLNQHT